MSQTPPGHEKVMAAIEAAAGAHDGRPDAAASAEPDRKANQEMNTTSSPAAEIGGAAALPPAGGNASGAAGDATPPNPFENPADTSIVDWSEVDQQMEQAFMARDKKRSRRKLAINIFLVSCLLGGAGGAFAWYQSSEPAQRFVHELAGNIRSVATGNDPASLTEVVDTCDHALGKVAGRGDQIREATAAMGVDVETVEADEAGRIAFEQEIESAMQDMMGGEGRTALERNRELRAKMRHLARSPEATLKVETN